MLNSAKRSGQLGYWHDPVDLWLACGTLQEKGPRMTLVTIPKCACFANILDLNAAVCNHIQRYLDRTEKIGMLLVHMDIAFGFFREPTYRMLALGILQVRMKAGVGQG